MEKSFAEKLESATRTVAEREKNRRYSSARGALKDVQRDFSGLSMCTSMRRVPYLRTMFGYTRVQVAFFGRSQKFRVFHQAPIGPEEKYGFESADQVVAHLVKLRAEHGG